MGGAGYDGRAAHAKPEVTWEPQPQQFLLLTCPIPDILFGGARGGGKSDALLGDWVTHASRSNGKARGILFRRTMPELDELVARAKELFPPLGAVWRAGARSWRFPDGATLKVRWLDRDEDASKYQGHSYTWVGVDEVGSWPEAAPIDKLRGTLRSAHGVPCVMRATANPGGVGQQWLKERYIDPAPPYQPFFDEARKQWRVFIPSKISDNRKLLDADPGYLDRLRSSGPPWLVRAWLEGDWEASAASPFFEEWAFLLQGKPTPMPRTCQSVFAVIDTAAKTGKTHDGTAVIYCAYDELRHREAMRSRTAPMERGEAEIPLHWLDYDYVQIEGALLQTWLPGVFARLEQLARQCGARMGSMGVYIEDKSAGEVLLQQAKQHGWNALPIESRLTALGKDERAQNAGNYVYQSLVKFTEPAFTKMVQFKDVAKNHLLSQLTSFRIGDKDAARRADDLLDCATYSIEIALGSAAWR